MPNGALVAGNNLVIHNRLGWLAAGRRDEDIVLIKGLQNLLPQQSAQLLCPIVGGGWQNATGQQPYAVVVTVIGQTLSDPTTVVHGGLHQ